MAGKTGHGNITFNSVNLEQAHKVSLAHNVSFCGQKLNHNVSGPRNIADPFSLFLAPEIVILCQFLGPEIMKMGQHISGPRN